MKLVCAADLHLGRVPSRLPAGRGLPLRELTPSAAWRALVERTIEERADALLLAGDVVDDPRDFFEAYADLRDGVERLAAAGVRVLAVAGNHDVEVLPRLADELPALRLLGRGGRWEIEELRARGERVRVLGWSFPSRTVTTSPFADGAAAALAAADGGPTIGLLHGDRDASGGPYAPFRRGDLRAVGADAWLLGHVHVPDALDPRAPAGYLGSLAATDPGEEGVRGAWRLVVEGSDLTLSRLPVAPLRYDTQRVPIDDLADAAEAPGAVVRALRALHERLGPERGGLRAVASRLIFTGRSDLGDALHRALRADDPRDAVPQTFDGVQHVVHDWRIEASPAVDLAAIAAGNDPLAVVAATLLTLGGDDAEARRRVLDAARPRLAAVRDRSAFAPLGAPEPDDEAIAARLLEAARRTFDVLLAQRDEPAP